MKHRITSIALALILCAGLFVASPTTVQAGGEASQLSTFVEVRYTLPVLKWYDADGNFHMSDKDVFNPNEEHGDVWLSSEVSPLFDVDINGEISVQAPDGSILKATASSPTTEIYRLEESSPLGEYKLISYPMPEGYELEDVISTDFYSYEGMGQDFKVNVSKTSVFGYANDAQHIIYVPIRKKGESMVSIYNSLTGKEPAISTVPEPSTPTPAPAPAPEPQALTATPTASTVLVNGQNVAFDAYNINNNNYFKLRDLAYILSGTEKQFEVTWDGANNAIGLISGRPYTAVGGEMASKGTGAKTPTPTSSKILLDGAEVSLTAYNIDNNNYFKLRDIGEALDFNVSWDGENNTIVIDTTESYTAD